MKPIHLTNLEMIYLKPDTARPWRAAISQLEFNVPFQHKYGYIRDERSGMESYPYPVKEG